jgi:uncharacterized secreted repeat protein (TIGR03808 family)
MRRASGRDLGLIPDSAEDQTERFQAAIDRVAVAGGVIVLAPGRYRVGELVLRPATRITGAHGAATLSLAPGRRHLLRGEEATGLVLSGLVLQGDAESAAATHLTADPLIAISRSADIVLSDLVITRAREHGLVLTGVSGRLTDSRIVHAGGAGIFSTDAAGFEITHNTVADCGDNGILVWRSRPGEDGTIVSANRIERIGARSGGSGQNGNGINVFRAGNVLVAGNRISDCAFTAIRGNTASNIQMVANSTSRLGEVALYAEFGFEGALIANNLVETAAAGISVTNFNEGGRLAVVQGNIIRNLSRREHEPVDKRGEGIAVEADAVVSGNVIENAPTAGIVIGWGRHMREVVASGNVIRQARIGIMITADPTAGACMVINNLVSGARDGAIRAAWRGVATGPDLVNSTSPMSRVAIAGNIAVSPQA